MVSIEIGNDYAAVAEGRSKGGKVRIYKAAGAKIEPGVVNGSIDSASDLRVTLKDLLKEINNTSKDAVITLNTDIYISKELKIPFVSKNELRSMLTMEMQQYLSRDNEYSVEYVLKDQKPKKNKEVTAWVCAVAKENVDTCAELLRELKLKPFRFDMNYNAVAKLFENASVNGHTLNDQVCILVDLGVREATAHIFEEGKRIYSKTIPIDNARVAFNDNYSNTLDKFDIVFSEFDFKAENLIDTPLLYEAANKYIDQVSLELRRFMQFQMSRNSQKPVSRLYIYGDMSKARGLVKSLNLALGTPVEKITGVSTLQYADQNSLQNVINLAGALISR